MSSDAATNFDEDWDWSERMQKAHAVDLYKRYWDGCEVVEVDSAATDEHVARQLDYGDVDKMIVKDDGTQIHLAQRFRRYHSIPGSEKSGEPDYDLTIRCHRDACEHTIEYQRLLNAYQSTGGSYPRCYAYGIVNPNGAEHGFRRFWLIKTDPLLDEITAGRIQPDEVSNGDGTRFRAVPIATLKEIGAVEHEWQLTTPHQNVDNPGVCERCQTWAWQRELTDIGSIAVWLCPDCTDQGGGGVDA